MVMEQWCNRMMVTLTNHAIARAGSTLHEVLAIWRFMRHVPGYYSKGQKKVLPSEPGAPGTLRYGKFGLGYCITFLKRIDEGLR